MDPIKTPAAQSQQPPKPDEAQTQLMPIVFTWQLKLALIGLGVVLFMLFVVRILPKNRTTPQYVSPAPSASADVQATPSGQLSAYAQTETFSQFSVQFDAYKIRLDSLDLSVNPLSFPLLDFNVQFDPK